MKHRTVKNILIASGCMLFAVGVLLLAGFMVCIGINDGEWGQISRTGSFSAPERLHWGPWQPNDGSVTVFRGYRPEIEKPEVSQYREGHVHGWLFNFTVYEGKAANSDGTIFPASGPHWGADYNFIWSFVTLALGTGLLIGARFAPSEELTGQASPAAAIE